MRSRFLFSLFQLLILSPAMALTQPTTLSGPNLLTGQKAVASVEGKKGLVVVFLSAVCPCSRSHRQELSALAADYPDFAFVAVHSNTDEAKDISRAYFAEANLPFAVIQDTGAKLADQYKALKTPHAFVINPSGEVLFQGGVSNSHEFEKADRKYLREALADIESHHAVKTREGRTLGCVITRGGKDVW